MFFPLSLHPVTLLLKKVIWVNSLWLPVFTTVILMALPYYCLKGQVVITEICPSNKTVIKDQFGEYEDWLELFNRGENPVNLKGYFLSDDSSFLDKWEFPLVVIPPKRTLLIFTSNKSAEDHRIVPPLSNAHFEHQWEYNQNDNALRPDWMDYDNKWLPFSPMKGNIEQKVEPNWYYYFRKYFYVLNRDIIKSAWLKVDFPVLHITVNGRKVYSVKPKSHPKPSVVKRNFKISKYIKPGLNTIAIESYNKRDEIFTIDTGNYKFNLLTNPDEANLAHIMPYASFGLSKEGESVYLSNPSLEIVDQVNYPVLKTDHSFGRKSAQQDDLVIFTRPTPGLGNEGSLAYLDYVQEVPVLSQQPGFYDKALLLEIFAKNGEIRYTTDGSIPSAKSNIYSVPFVVDSTTVIRARIFERDKIAGETVTKSYFIAEHSTLPVFSVTADPALLFDPDSGICVTGPYLKYRVIDDFSNRYANFFLDKEIPGHIEYFSADSGRLLFNQDMGMKIHGDYARIFPQKSFQFFARDEYGQSSINYPLFPDKEINSFGRFILRSGGDEWGQTNFRDGLVAKLASTTNVDMMDFEPVTVFVNGSYWGIMNLREKISKYYLQENHRVDKNDVVLLTGDNPYHEVELLESVYEFIYNSDMRVPVIYETARSMLDMENFCDYFIIQTYINNHDNFPENIKYWRELSATGKWRYILFDTDDGLGGHDQDLPSFNRLQMILNYDTIKQDINTKMFNSLLDNSDFRNYFVTRYLDLINTIFSPSHFKKLALEIKRKLEPEMPRHMARWAQGAAEVISKIISVAQWNDEIDKVLIPFIEQRPAFERQHLNEAFGLGDEASLTLNVYPASAGKIRINTVEPDSFPWTGLYFSKITITITAIPNPGYAFSGWSKEQFAASQHQSTATFRLTKDQEITALFKKE